MRLLLACSLFGVLLSLTGCGMQKWFRGEGSRAGGGGTGQPFVGSPSADAPSPTEQISADTGTLASKDARPPGKAILAGQVLDNAGRRVPRAKIEIIEENPPKDDKAAPLAVETDKAGWFTLSGLEGGKWYQLRARVNDGSRDLVGSTRAQAPNIRIAIPLTNIEPVGGHPDAEKKPKEEKTTSSPAATLQPPLNPRKGAAPPPPPPVEEERPAPEDPIPSLPPAPNNPPANPELIANDKSKTGFQTNPTVEVPGPGREPNRKPPTPYAPPPPPTMREDRDLKPSSAPSAIPGPSVRIDDPREREDSSVPSRLVIPSCVRTGERLENFALYDYDGRPWELKKQRRGKVMLIDFWFANCGPCRQALPAMVELDRKYRRFGLDIVGIAHEQGSLAEKQDMVRPLKARAGITYPIVFSGGDNCPVLRQCEVHQYPTLLLLDDTGKIVLRTSGLNARAKYDLEMEIRRRLGLR